MNNHYDFFKKFFCGSKLCVMCLSLVCIFLGVCFYNIFSSPKIILPQPDFRGDYDTVSKHKKVYSETEQKVKQKSNGNRDQLEVPGMNATHINGILMETVNADYTRNIYFTVKTTHKFYTDRLFPVILT